MKDISKMSSDEIAELQKKCEARLDTLEKNKVQRWINEIKQNRLYTHYPWKITLVTMGGHGPHLILEPATKDPWPELIKFGEMWEWHEIHHDTHLGVMDYDGTRVPRILVEGSDLAGGLKDLGIAVVGGLEKITSQLECCRGTIKQYTNCIQELERVQKLIDAQRRSS